jgi:hypothetical protein
MKEAQAMHFSSVRGEGRTRSLALLGKRIPDSVIRVELITFFHRYPGTHFGACEIAERLERDPLQVEAQLERLAQLNILEKSEMEGETVYRYRPPYCAAWEER